MTATASTAAAGLLMVASAIWPFVNAGPLEGPLLWTAGAGHGLTASDLLTPPGVGAAAARLLLARRGRPGGMRSESVSS